MKKLFIIPVFLFPLFCAAQGWIDVTPPLMSGEFAFEGYNFKDGSYKLVTWRPHDIWGYIFEDGSRQKFTAYISEACDISGTSGLKTNYILTWLSFTPQDPDIVASVYEYSYCDDWQTGTYITFDIDNNFQYDATKTALYPAKEPALIALSPVSIHRLYAIADDTLYFSESFGKEIKVLAYGKEIFGYPNHLSLSPHNPRLIFTSCDADSSGTTALFRSDDGGMNWTNVFRTSRSIIRKSHKLFFDPFAVFTVYLSTPDGIFKSTDGGTNWSKIFADNGEHAFAADPDSVDVLYAGNKKGAVYKSTNGGNSWMLYNTISGTGIPDLEIRGIFKVQKSDTMFVACRGHLLKVFAPQPLSYIDEELPAIISVSPNPATDFIRISLPHANEKNSFVIITLLGQKILSEECIDAKETIINTAGIPAGNYLLAVGNSIRSRTHPLTIIR